MAEEILPDTSEIKGRTFKIEITLENGTDKNIQPVIKTQRWNTKNKLCNAIKSGVVALETIVRPTV